MRDERSGRTPRLGVLRRFLGRSALGCAILACGLLLGLAFQSRGLPDLAAWHRVEPLAEFAVEDLSGDFDFEDYLELETRLFREVEERVVEGFDATVPHALANRYRPGGANNPLGFPRNWNRSYERSPEEVRGGVVLVHGLTDSPYSLRRVGEILEEEGLHVVGLRLPGHGTVPGALTSADWEDWLAALRLAVRRAESVVGDRGPLWIVGYSSGAALALLHTLDSLENGSEPRPDRLVLISPAIGVTPFAALAHFHRVLSHLDYFEKFRWVEVKPEYDPFKYASFPKHAADQSCELSTRLQEALREAQDAGRMKAMPPVLAFQSVIDDTVSVAAVLEELFGRLEGPDHELVFFDINRAADTAAFVARDPVEAIPELGARRLDYRLTLVTNADGGSSGVEARSRAPGALEAEIEALGLGWPASLFSLSHVALPFPPDDPVYGAAPAEGPGFHLGALHLRGERNLLQVSADDFMRLRYNPFFAYLERRLRGLRRRVAPLGTGSLSPRSSSDRR